MAGGSDRRGFSGVPLHARVRASPAPGGTVPQRGGAGPPTGAPGTFPADPCPGRHCWVEAPADGGPARPGLLLEWRKGGTGRWEGRVVYAAELRPGTWATVEEWLVADLLSTA